MTALFLSVPLDVKNPISPNAQLTYKPQYSAKSNQAIFSQYQDVKCREFSWKENWLQRNLVPR